MTALERSKKRETARNSVPEVSRPEYDQSVEHYKLAATKHHGSPYISHVVLAELVQLGWRCRHQATSDEGGLENE